MPPDWLPRGTLPAWTRGALGWAPKDKLRREWKAKDQREGEAAENRRQVSQWKGLKGNKAASYRPVCPPAEMLQELYPVWRVSVGREGAGPMTCETNQPSHYRVSISTLCIRSLQLILSRGFWVEKDVTGPVGRRSINLFSFAASLVVFCWGEKKLMQTNGKWNGSARWILT